MRAVETIRESGAEAVAVTLLHSYANGAHERAIGEIVRRELPGCFVTLSVELLPEIREYERTSTAVINAYVGPPVRRYVESLVDRMRESGIPGRLMMMQSSGGMIDAATAMSKPAEIVECGPAAGVIGAAHVGRRIGCENIITLDMGGTTAKASLIVGRAVVAYRRVRGGRGHLAQQPPGEGRRIRPQDPGHRHRGGGGRRREHRVARQGRSDQDRPGERGRRSGARSATTTEEPSPR